jgi:hypothetical protein
MSNEIDEDGEKLLTTEEIVLDLLKDAQDVKGWLLDDCGNRETELDILDWDHTANNEMDIPDIVIEANRTTIFYDELKDALVFGNTINIGNRYEFLIS